MKYAFLLFLLICFIKHGYSQDSSNLYDSDVLSSSPDLIQRFSGEKNQSNRIIIVVDRDTGEMLTESIYPVPVQSTDMLYDFDSSSQLVDFNHLGDSTTTNITNNRESNQNFSDIAEEVLRRQTVVPSNEDFSDSKSLKLYDF